MKFYSAVLPHKFAHSATATNIINLISLFVYILYRNVVCRRMAYIILIAGAKTMIMNKFNDHYTIFDFE